jgi:CheY-like chemotaxis protein
MDLPSAEEAMLVLFRHRVDLLIVDFRLPGISGLEFMDKVRRRNPDVRVIMITGVQDRQIKRRIAEAGAFAFFLKPVHMTEFLNAVQNALGSPLEAVPTIQEKPEQTQEPAGEIVSLLQATPTKFNPTHYLQRILVETKAASAALINENGEISHHYGELLLSTEKEAVWKQIVGLILNGKTLVDSFRSSQNDFILSLSSLAWTMTASQVDDKYCLVIFSESTSTAAWNELISPIVNELRHGLQTARQTEKDDSEISAAYFAENREPETPELVEQTELSDEDLQSMEALFQTAPEVIASGDPDTFWDMVVEGSELDGNIKDNALSYDEALKLGLTPTEE